MIRCPLSLSAEQFPDHIACRGAGYSWTYRALDRLVCERMSQWRAHGVEIGQKVPISAAYTHGFIVDFFALIRLGAVVEILQSGETCVFSKVLASEKLYSGWVSEAQPVTCLKTSGTSGYPKSCLHTLGQYLASARVVNQVLSVTDQSCVWITIPLYHVGGLSWLFRAVIAGACIVFDLQFGPVTHVSLVPTQLQRLLKADCLAEYLQMKAIFVGGAALSESVLQLAWAKGLPVVVSYGLTEMTSSVAIRQKGQMGFVPLPHVSWRLAITGEILVKGASLFMGYEDEDVVVLETDAEGWFATRDCGDLSGAILGRLDDLIVSGGENIWPAEIVQALMQLPEIDQARVSAMDDEDYGQRPVAHVVLMPNVRFDEQVIRGKLRAFLPGYKLPIRVFEVACFESWKL